MLALQAILLESGIPKSSILFEAGGLRRDKTRPRDVVVLDFFGLDRHLVVDVVLSIVYRNTILDVASTVPSHAAKLAEDRKFATDKVSCTPVSSVHGGDHVLVPFSMEDGGRFGAHALALLKILAERAVSSHLFVSGTGELPGPPAMQVSLWVQRWQSRLSAWLHLTLSQHLLRLYRPDGLSGLFLS